MHGRRIFIAYAIFGPLAFLSAYYVTGINDFAQLGRVATALVLLALAERFFRVLPRRSALAPFTATLLLCATWLVQPLSTLLLGSGTAGLLGLREALYTAIWLAGIWIAFLAIEERDDAVLAIRLLDWLGILIAASVYLALAAHRFGVTFGDVQESAYGLRVFGPLGDMVTYVLLLFLFRELARGAWPRFAIYLPAFLLGRTRGALGALLVGLLAAAALEAWRLVRRERAVRGRSRVLPLVTCGAIVLAGLFFSEAGRGLLERFASIDVLGGDTSSAARWRTIELSWQLFAEHPLLGVGPGGYAAYVENEGLSWSYVDAEDPRLPGRRRFHLEFTTAAQNQISQLAAETGALGLLAFLAWSAIALRTLHRAATSDDRELATFFAGAELYAIAILIGTQSTCYLMDKSSIAYLLLLTVGMADRVVGARRPLPAGAPAITAAHGRRPAYAVASSRVGWARPGARAS